jgi:tetraacyldisaccharide 4'-kinase
MCKIISVGNISLGGTGKTPFCIFLAEKLLNDGARVCILSRGYKGKIGLDTHIVHDGSNFLLNPSDAADEPFLIASKLKKACVITGKNRCKSFNTAKKVFNPDYVILDDGFQHRRMGRDIDIVLIDHSNPLSTGFIFPFGYLRERPKSLSKADIIVFTRAENCKVPEKVTKYISDKPVFFSNTKIDGFYLQGRMVDENFLNDSTFFLFSGIASNRNFFNMICNTNISVKGKKFYSDHHFYSERDFNSLIDKKKKSGADFFLTTEKDYVKLPEYMKEQTVCLQISLTIDNEKGFWDTLFDKL